MIGLLVCDRVRDEFVEAAGDYPDMFQRLLADRLELKPFFLMEDNFPNTPHDCDGWITTGSRHSVYEDIPWIHRFADLTRQIAASGVPMVGVCFGQQMIAHALGGRVEKSDRGWGVGIKEVTVTQPQPWMGSSPSSFRILNSHQDQVVEAPPGATVIASNAHCPVSAMALGENIITFQGHPEFEPAYSRALMEARRGTLIPEEVVDAGLLSLEVGPDRELLVDWIVRFFEMHLPRAD